jgi:hypothetical protein
MAREPVAVDFFGLGNSLVENDSGHRQGEADSSIPPVKPIASIPEKQVVEMSRAVTPVSESEGAIGRENSISILRQASSSSQAEQARPPAGGRGEEMQGMQKLSWNNQQSIQQVLSHRHQPDSRGKDEATGKREFKDGPQHISSPALSEWEQTNKSSPSYPQAVCCHSICLSEVFLLHSCLDNQIFLVLEKPRFIIADTCCSVTDSCKWMKSVTMLL